MSVRGAAYDTAANLLIRLAALPKWNVVGRWRIGKLIEQAWDEEKT